MSVFKYLLFNSIEATALQSLRNDVKTYLDTEVLLHFTDHGIGHSDRMVDIIGSLIQPIQDGPTGLCITELSILYAACYLHDLGMHVENLKGLKSVPPDWHELPKTIQENLIRNNHHTISAELVEMASQKSGPCSALHLKNLCPDQVACLCEAHNLWLEKQEDKTRYVELTQDTGGMRMGFIAALLRLADILDESQARAGIDKSHILDLDIESLKHWWRHYYTEHIKISEVDRTLTLEFKFPKNKEDEYSGIITELQYPYISEEMQRHAAILTKNKCNWLLNKIILSTPYSTKEEMPQDVELSMLTELQRRRIEREEQERIAALTDLREARPVIDRAIKHLVDKKNILSPTDYIKEAIAIHQRLWLAGGKRSAFGSLGCIFREIQESLPLNVRLECACQLSAWSRECGSEFFSAQELHKLLPLAERLAEENPLCSKFYRELFHCLYDIGITYTDACKAAKKALSASSSDSDKLEILADLAEMSYLLAEPAVALSVLEEHEELYNTFRTKEGLRCRLLRWRLLAMKGRSIDVIAEVDAFTKEYPDWTGNSHVWKCLLLKAEILRLMGDLPAANSVFRDQIWINVKALPPAETVVIANCYQDVALNVFEKDPLIEWSAHVDERITAGVEFEDSKHALEGYDSGEDDKHYDALPAFLKAFRNVYKQGSWSAQHNACGRLALETVDTGNIHDATFYCILGSSKARNTMVAKALINCSNSNEFLRALNTMLEFSHLPLHAQCACELLGMIGDEIPDSIMPEVVRYLLKCTDFRTSGGFSQTTISEAAWAALESIATRIDITVAQEVADKILAANLPMQNVLLRRKLTPVLTQLIAKLDHSRLRPLAEATVSILTDQKHEIDFSEGLNLLVEIASKAPLEVKTWIRDCIYTDGKCKKGYLLQLAKFFDVRPTSEELHGITQWLLERLKSEVQVYDLDVEVPQLGTSNFTRVVNDKRVVTYDIPSVVMMGIARNISEISEQTRSALLSALLANLKNQEDSINNKCAILSVLPLILNACDNNERNIAVRIILDIASSEPVAPSGMQTKEEANHPLQRFRMHAGSPDQVRGSAIRCLTQSLKEHSVLSPTGGVLQVILEKGVASTSEDVRRSSFLAAQSNVLLANQTLLQILIGTRDESPNAAAAALYVFAYNMMINVGSFADLLCYTLRYAVRSPAKTVRLAAARLLARLEGESLTSTVAEEVSRLADILRVDRAWSIRQAIDLKKHDSTIDATS